MTPTISDLLLYYGSAVVPLAYLAVTRFRGRHGRAMLIALGLHLLMAVATATFILWSRSAGYREWYWGWNCYNVPMNGLFALVYLALLCRRP
jgi:hypothetical protein